MASVISRFSTSAWKNGHSAYSRRSQSSRSPSSPKAAKPLPQPYQAGSRQRFCVQENTHGIARSACSWPVETVSGRTAGREPISSSASSRTGVKSRKNGRNSVVLPDERAVGAVGRAGDLLDRVAGALVRRLERNRLREGGQEGRGERGLEIPLGEPGQPVLEGDRLALLGQLEAAVDRAGRLREDRRVGRAAAAPGAAAAAVEDGQLDAALGRRRAAAPPGRGRSPTAR